MHIHGAQQNLGQSLHAAREAGAAAAAERAEANRKKLLGAAAEIDASASAESAWMIAGWGGSGSGGRGASQHGSHYDAPTDAETSSRQDKPEAVARASPSAPVSFWA